MTFETGWQLAVYETATSTSDVIFSQHDAAEGLCVLARQQTKGRGRHGRVWTSALDDGMYLSILLSPTRPVQDWPSLSFIAALGLFKALKQLFPDLPAGLKWPNDVLVNHKKISGILLEARQDKLVLGCGVNLKNAPDVPDASFPPTDLAQQTGQIIAPTTLADCFIQQFYNLYQSWQVSGFSAHYDLYKSHLLFLSEQITVTQGEHKVTGLMKDITKAGGLLLENASGTINEITTGDVNLIGFSDAAGD